MCYYNIADCKGTDNILHMTEHILKYKETNRELANLDLNYYSNRYQENLINADYYKRRPVTDKFL